MKKSLQELNLLDRFLFAEAMEKPEFAKNVLEIILGKEIVLSELPQTEKEGRTFPAFRGIRMDVWAQDTEGTVYDTEVQRKDTKNLPKRSRYYQALIDCKLLEPGEVDFNKLSNAYVILIAPFDLFGKDRYVYTFSMKCKEEPDTVLEDGAVRIFLNTRGKNEEEVGSELAELLHFMEHTTEETARICKSERIRQMQNQIEAIKASEEVGVRYMQAWEEKELDRRAAREEGREEGMERMTKLTALLLEQKRMTDLERAVKDPVYQEQLLNEFGI